MAKNIGQSYLSKALERAGVNKCKITEAFAKKLQRKQRKGNYWNLQNRRKLKLRTKRKSDTSTELREGDTYQSGVLLNSNCDTVEIPASVSVPELLNIPNGDYLFIAFDVETTSLEDDCDFVQLSAVLITSHFDAYVITRKQITSSASRVTGLTAVGSQLLLHGKPVSTVDIHSSLRNFITWLQSHGKPVVLYGHNVKFDAKVILRSCTEAGVLFFSCRRILRQAFAFQKIITWPKII